MPYTGTGPVDDVDAGEHRGELLRDARGAVQAAVGLDEVRWGVEHVLVDTLHEAARTPPGSATPASRDSKAQLVHGYEQ